MSWVRRRRDERDARGRLAQPADVDADLVAGKLAALAGLGSLRHFYLDLLRAGEVGRVDAEPPAGNLLDRAVGEVAVFAGGGTVPGPRRPRRCCSCRRCGSWRWRGIRGASGLSAPSDMPAVVNRRRMSSIGSTSSSGIGSEAGASSSRSRRAMGVALSVESTYFL